MQSIVSSLAALPTCHKQTDKSMRFLCENDTDTSCARFTDEAAVWRCSSALPLPRGCRQIATVAGIATGGSSRAVPVAGGIWVAVAGVIGAVASILV